jgi:RHS repeat-associated protein
MSNKSGTSSQVISLPKGGGAQHGIGEKFSPDLHTGTGNFTVPIALPPGRNGFQPQLSLVYSTGNGNSPFGLGWNLSIPGVMRKTSEGIPRYDDAKDIFVLSGAEDLVPVEQQPGLTRYQPRTEGLFAKILHHQDPGNNYWEVKSKDGLVSLYGTPAKAGNDPSAISNSTNRSRVFAWKLTRTTDPFGNRIDYVYERDGVQTDGFHRWDQLYLSEIRYVDYGDSANPKFLVRVKFIYETRPDPFSDYRAGFEIRTVKRCSWIEVFTRPDPDPEILTRTYHLVYLDQRGVPEEQLPLNRVSLLSQVRVEGHDDANPDPNQRKELLPPLEFRYSQFEPKGRDFFPITGADMPPGSLARPEYELADLFGNGLPDVLEMNGTVRYWRNLGNGKFDRPREMKNAPAGLQLADPGVQMIDADGDGRIDLLVTTPGLSGYFPLRFGGLWDRKSFQRYEVAPSFNLEDPEVKLVDLTGDGVTDAIRSGSRMECFFNDPKKGWKETKWIERQALDKFPNINFSDPQVKWGDMAGDGLQDILLVHDGNVEYWPNLGYGLWGDRISMKNSPRYRYGYDPRRILVGDVDGDGLADIVYVDDKKVILWINQSGNGWSDPIEIKGTPPVSDMDAVWLVDLLGTGIAGVLWSADAGGLSRQSMFFLDFTGGVKPYLLNEMDNHMGALTRVGYRPSIQFYLEDEKRPETRWKTPLPFPVQVVAKVEVIDQISNGKLTTEYRYHHGYWDGGEREFRGFARVEQRDTEVFESFNLNGLHDDRAFEQVEAKRFSPPLETRTWFHQGPVGDEFGEWEELDLSDEYWIDDPQVLTRPDPMQDFLKGLPRRVKRDALRTLRGSVLRTELYALDGKDFQDRPYTVTESIQGVREESPPSESDRDRQHIFLSFAHAQRTTQWERGNEPMTQFSFTEDYDDFGQPQRQTTIACPRGWRSLSDTTTDVYLATRSRTVYAEPLNPQVYIRDRVAKTTTYEITNTNGKTVEAIATLADNSPDLKTIGQTLNFYDGQAFQGLPYRQVEKYGALVRSLRQCHHDTETDISLPKRDETITTVEYSDGFGRLLQTRTQAEEVLFGDRTFGGGILPIAQNDEVGTRQDAIGQKNTDSNNPNVVVSGWQTYDNKGRVVEKYEPFFSTGWNFIAPTDAQTGQKVAMFYDPRGQVIRTLNPDGSEQRVIYGIPDNLNQPDRFKPTPWEAYTYDANDLATLSNSPTGTPLTNAAPTTHHFTPASIEIDGLGRTVKAVERNGSNPATDWYTTRSTYDIRGNVLTITDALGRLAFRHVYDLANRKLRIDSIDAGVRRMVLDVMGNPVEQRDSKGALTLHAYDLLNRPTHLWARDGAGQVMTLRERSIYGDNAESGMTRAQAQTNNLLGKPYRHYEEAGLVILTACDFKGNPLGKVRRVIRNEQILGVFNSAPASNWQVVAYRVNWQPTAGTTLEVHANALLEAKAYVTSMEYDALNRVKVMRYPQDVNNTRQELRPEYNRAGALERVLLNGKTYVDRIAYNAKGQRVLIAYGNGVMTRHAYDPQTFRLVRLRSQPYDHPNPLTYQPKGAALQEFAYEYDLVGNITAIHDRTPGSGVAGNLPLGANGLDRSFTYDPLYRLLTATGRECKDIPQPRPWEDEPRCGFNSGNHGTPNQDNAPNLTALYREGYAYDAGGNMLNLKHQQLSPGGNWDTTWSRNFGMDGLTPEQWDLEWRNHLVGEWNNPPSNRLTHVENRRSGVATPPVVPQTHFFDDNGNLIRENNSRHFEWDYGDRMRVFRTQTGNAEPSVHAHYLYDASGQRVKKLVRKQGGQIEVTVYIDGAFQYQRIVQGGVTRENNTLHVMDNQSRIALVRVGNPFPDDTTPAVKYHLGDHLGSSNVVVDEVGNWVNREEFTPYGETSFGSFARKRYRFTGKERDEESGLNYHGARYYAPWLIRWTSCDPKGSVDGLNLYRYVHNNPVKLIDLLGHQAKDVHQASAGSGTSQQPSTSTSTSKNQTSQTSTSQNQVASSSQSQPRNATSEEPKADLLNQLEREKNEIQETVSKEQIPKDKLDQTKNNPMDEAHIKNVLKTINWSTKVSTDLKLVEYFLKDSSWYTKIARGEDLKSRLTNARLLITDLRQKSNKNSESLILRDAQYYLWGRTYITDRKENIPWIPDIFIETYTGLIAHDVYTAQKAFEIKTGIKTLVGKATEHPYSGLGGGFWYDLGVTKWVANRDFLEKNASPALLTREEVMNQYNLAKQNEALRGKSFYILFN